VNNTLAVARTVSDQFWSTTALVIPVLALALVVEVRATIARWKEGFPWWLRSVQGILWVYVLALFAIVEYVAFADLANNNLTSSAWTQAARASITQSIITLIVTPALEVLTRSNARIIGEVIGRLVRLLWQRKIVKLYFGVRKIERYLDDERERLEKNLLRVTIVEKRIRAEGPVGNDDYDRDLAAAESTNEEIKNQLAMLADKGRSILTEARANLDEAKKVAAWGRKEIRTIVEKTIDETPEIDESSPPGTAGPAADETAP
jgi:hypothetical protein